MTPKKILVATDFSEQADKALDYAIELADRLDAKITIVNAVVNPVVGVPEFGLAVTSTMIEGIIKANQESLDKLATRAAPGRIQTKLDSGDARDVIIDAAKSTGADLIIMGTHGRRGLKRALLGSVAEAVLRHASVPVLIVPVRD